MVRRTAIVAFLLTAIAASGARAETGYSITPLGYVYLGLVAANGIVAVGNGVTVLAGTASARNGKFGVGLGAATTVLGLALAAVAEGDDKNAGVFLAGVGLIDVMLGATAMRAATGWADAHDVTPIVRPVRGGAEMGFRLRF